MKQAVIKQEMGTSIISLKGLNFAIKVKKEIIKSMETALKHNEEWPSEKEKYETALHSYEEEKHSGWLAKIITRFLKHKIEKASGKAPKKLNETDRTSLEALVNKEKDIVASYNTNIKRGKVFRL